MPVDPTQREITRYYGHDPVEWSAWRRTLEEIRELEEVKQ